MRTIDNNWAAFLLVEILYEKELINEETYNNVLKSVSENRSYLNEIGSDVAD